jgi:hypothetical protein
MKSSRILAETLIILAAVLILFNLCVITIASAQEHEAESKFTNVVSIEGKSGLNLIVANIYNDKRLMFALGGTLLMAIMGLSLGQIAEMVIKILGIKRPRKS